MAKDAPVRTIFITSFVLALCQACGSEPPLRIDPIVEIKAEGFTRDDAIQALAAFKKACMPLGGDMWEEIVRIEMEIFSEYAAYRLARGWKTTMHLRLSLPPDGLKRIPTYHPDTSAISGQVLHYFLGGGSAPGFFAQKRVSQYLCGLKVDQKGPDVFDAVPELAILK